MYLVPRADGYPSVFERSLNFVSYSMSCLVQHRPILLSRIVLKLKLFNPNKTLLCYCQSWWPISLLQIPDWS